MEETMDGRQVFPERMDSGLLMATEVKGGCLRLTLWSCFLLLAFPSVWSQVQDSGQSSVDSIVISKQEEVPATPFLTDTAMLDSLLVDSTQVEEAVPLKPVLTSDTIAVFLLRRVEDLALTLNQINRHLQMPIDTSDLDLEQIDLELQTIETYYGQSDQDAVDFRTLNSIESILLEIREGLDRFEVNLLENNRQLISYQSSIERIERDSLNRLLPRDPVLRASYVNELDQLTERYREARDMIRARLLEIGLWQNRLTRLNIRTNDLLARTERLVNQYRSQMFIANHPPLLKLTTNHYQAGLRRVSGISWRVASDTLQYFFRFNWGIRLINITIILSVYFFARTMLARIRRKHEEDAAVVLSPATYFNHYPVIGALVVGLTIVPFMYGTPPLAFVEIIWILLFTLMSWLVSKRFTQVHFSLWLVLLVIFVLNGFIILMISTTFIERWVLFAVNLLSVGLGIGLLTKGRISRSPASRYWLSRIVFWLFTVMNGLALLTNFFGFYNVAVLLSYSGSFQILYVMALWVFIELIGELAYLYIEANKDELKAYSSWLDYQDLQQRLKRILGFLAVVLWLGAFLKSLNVFDPFYDFAYAILSKPRSIGSAGFTYGSLLVFIGIVYASVLISRLLAYVFGNHGSITSSGRKNNLGSTMLLVRIAILAGGFLLALSAAGISLDKVAIILGALGVGIGFGLQNIVNNLVSGIILAFEKPIKIGDVIELGPFIGKVKEIGIRSSKVVTFDGADVIIPNGDLLSQHLTNWTLSNHSRRVELIVGVGYGSDIPTVRDAMLRAINAQEKISHYPVPLVMVHNFSDSSVDFRILFWTNRFDEWISVKSDTLGAIYDELHRSGIEIPFPKRDVFVHYPEESGQTKELKSEIEGQPTRELADD